MVVEEYLSNFDFSGMTIDQALRSVHKTSVLTCDPQDTVLPETVDQSYITVREVWSVQGISQEVRSDWRNSGERENPRSLLQEIQTM